MPDTTNALVAARDVLVAHRHELEAEISRIQMAIDSLNALVSPAAKQPTRRRVLVRRSKVKPAIARILRDSQRIMHADEIVTLVKESGVPLSAKDPKATVVTALRRLREEGEVVAVGGNNYYWREHEDVITPRETAAEGMSESIPDDNIVSVSQPDDPDYAHARDRARAMN